MQTPYHLAVCPTVTGRFFSDKTPETKSNKKKKPPKHDVPDNDPKDPQKRQEDIPPPDWPDGGHVPKTGPEEV